MARTETSPDRLMDINAVAERCNVRVRFIRRLVAKRRIPYVKLGHLLRFDPTEIDAWVDRARVRDGDRDHGRPR
jgi:excisionase family DNA binding protein